MQELITPKEIKISEIKENLSFSPNNYKKILIRNSETKKISFYLDETSPFAKGIEPGSAAYVDKSGQSFIRNSCINSIQFSVDKTKYIYLNPTYSYDCKLENEDLLLCTDANIGDACIYLSDGNKNVYSSGIIKLNFKDEKYKWYILAFLRDNYFKEQLKAKTPKGATISHSGDLFMSCEIPSCDEPWIYSCIESIVKNIVYSENECRKKIAKSSELFDNEIMLKKYTYVNPSIKKIALLERLDSSIYSDAVFQWENNVKNYKNGYTDLNGFGFKTKRGPSLQKRDLGRSIQTDIYRKGYNILIYPSDISDSGYIEKISYLGAKNKVWFLEEKYILFSSQGKL